MVTKTVDLKDFAEELKEFNKAHIEKQKIAAANGIGKSIPDLVEIMPPWFSKKL
jgi:hypothetical protein